MPKKKNHKNQEDEETGGGGQSGQVAFRDFIGTGGNARDDQMPPDERRRLLASHALANESSVKKQKQRRDEYNDLKSGKTAIQDFRQGLAHGDRQSNYKANPILANKAQFSGIDRQVTMLPNENISDTNDENRNKLENEYQLQNRLQLQHAPTFNPKPQPK